jgi:hypothetical protein
MIVMIIASKVIRPPYRQIIQKAFTKLKNNGVNNINYRNFEHF